MAPRVELALRRGFFDGSLCWRAGGLQNTKCPLADGERFLEEKMGQSAQSHILGSSKVAFWFDCILAVSVTSLCVFIVVVDSLFGCYW